MDLRYLNLMSSTPRFVPLISRSRPVFSCLSPGGSDSALHLFQAANALALSPSRGGVAVELEPLD
jgi:hypothetical protein